MLTNEQLEELKDVCKEAEAEVEEDISKFTIPVDVDDFRQMAVGYDIMSTENGLPFFTIVLSPVQVAQIAIDPESITAEALAKSGADKDKYQWLKDMGLPVPNREMRRRMN